MAHPATRLRKGEKIILDTRPHWWHFVRPLFMLLLSLFAGVWALLSFSQDNDGGAGSDLFNRVIAFGAGLLIFFSVGILIISGLSWYFTHFFLTNDRIVNRSGVFNRRGSEIPIERINTVFFEQNILERMVGSGDILVESAGESGLQRFVDIANLWLLKKKFVNKSMSIAKLVETLQMKIAARKI